MSDQMNPMGPAEPEIMSQDAENVIGLQPGQSDREGAMAKADLYKIANYSHKLFKQINDEDQMEAWVQAKITKAADYIASVYHYLEYEMKFSQYGQALEDSEVYSESQKQAIKNRLMEAKDKVKELKLKQAKKAKDDAADKVSEGVLSGGHKACTECGGSGMVYEEPKAIPDHVKGKVEKYNRQAKAFHAASKRIDRNNDGIDDRLQSPDVEEGFGETDKDELKVGQKKKTRTGELERVSDTTTRHTNTSYNDQGDEIAANARSGKGIKSHAKGLSAAEKKEQAPKQKQSPKSAKTWGMKDSEKFDNRDGAPAKPKKEKEAELEESLKGGRKKLDVNKNGKLEKDDFAKLRAGKVKETAVSGAPQKSGIPTTAKTTVPGMRATGADLKKANASAALGEAGKGKNDLSKKKDVKEAAAAMWNNIKETQTYIAEKKAKTDWDKDGKRESEQEEHAGVVDKAIKANKKEVVKESADLTRIKQFLTRLNG